jgi:hypothetical protein
MVIEARKELIDPSIDGWFCMMISARNLCFRKPMTDEIVEIKKGEGRTASFPHNRDPGF